MRTSNLFSAFRANKTALGFAHRDKPVAVKTTGAIQSTVSIDNTTVDIGTDSPLYAGSDKGTALLLGLSFSTHCKTALRGFCMALALCLSVSAAETPSLRQIGEELPAEQHTNRDSGSKANEKSNNRRGQVLSEKRSCVHQVTFCIGFIAGVITGMSIIYTIIWLTASIAEHFDK